MNANFQGHEEQEDLEPAVRDKMDELLSSAWLSGSDEAFHQIFHLILCENVSGGLYFPYCTMIFCQCRALPIVPCSFVIVVFPLLYYVLLSMCFHTNHTCIIVCFISFNRSHHLLFHVRLTAS